MKKRNTAIAITAAAVSCGMLFAFAGCSGGPKYKLTFDTNGCGVIEYELSAGDKIPSPSAPAKDMFEFGGWYTDETYEVEFAPSGKMPESDMTVYALWIPSQSSRITYVTNGGTAVSPQIGVVGSEYVSPAVPTREGYVFDYWCVDEGLQFSASFTVYPEGNTTLYAKWRDDNAYSFVTFVGNGREVKRVPVKGGKIEDPELFPGEKTSGWFIDAELTVPFSFDTAITQNIELYAAHYTEGLDITDGVVTGYNGTDEHIVIPDRFGGKEVTTVGAYAFSDAGIKSVDLPHTVRSLDNGAFYNCRYLETVNITTDVTRIGVNAFFNNERLISIGDISAITRIPAGAFLGCKKLSKIKIPAGVTEIGAQAFGGCARITEMTIPDSVTEVSDYLFAGCTSLKTVKLPAAMTSFGDGVFNGCENLEKVELINGDKFTLNDGMLVKSGELVRYIDIGKKEITIPSSVTYVASRCFEYNDVITSITVESASTVLSCGVFEKMTALESLTVPSFGGKSGETGYLAYLFGRQKPTSMGDKEFAVPDTFVTVTVTGAVNKVSDYAFYGVNSLKTINGLDNATALGAYAFAYTGIESFTFGDKTAEVDGTTFMGCKNYKEAKTSGSAYTVFDGCLYNASGTKLISVPSGKTTVKFPSTITEIGAYAAAASELVAVAVPDTVKKIGEGAFMSCRGLSDFSVPFIGSGDGTASYLPYIFGSRIETTTGANGKYTDVKIIAASRIPTSLNKITITGKVDAVPDFAFASVANLRSVVLNGKESGQTDMGVTSYGAYAFYKTRLENIDLKGVTTIGEYAFSECDLKEIAIPGTAVNLGESCFASNQLIEKITLEEGITSIADSMFYSFTTTGSASYDYGDIPISQAKSVIVIPASVVTIGKNAFYGLGKSYVYNDETDMEESRRNDEFDIYFASGSKCETIGESAFSETGIAEFVVPASVKTIGKNAFLHCEFLKTAAIGTAAEGSAVTSIGMWAFARCIVLKDVSVYANVPPTLSAFSSSDEEEQEYVGTWTFFDSKELETISVPAAAVDAYKAARGWKEYQDFIKSL